MSIRFASILVSLLLSALVVPCAAADQVVYFINGKAMIVKKVESGDGLTILEMEGGGRIGVPSAQIERIEEFTLSVPATPGVAAPVANQIVQGAPQTVAPAQQAAIAAGRAAVAVPPGGPRNPLIPDDGSAEEGVAGNRVAPMGVAAAYARTGAPGGAAARQGMLEPRGAGGRSDLGVIGRPGTAGPGSGRRLSGLLRSFSAKPATAGPSTWVPPPSAPPPQFPGSGGDAPADQGQGDGGRTPQDPGDGGGSSPVEGD